MKKEQFIENVKNGIEDLVDRKLNKYDTGIAYKLASKELIIYFISDLDRLLQAEREEFVQIVEAERQNTILSIDDVRTMWINQMCDRLTKTIRKLK